VIIGEQAANWQAWRTCQAAAKRSPGTWLQQLLLLLLSLKMLLQLDEAPALACEPRGAIAWAPEPGLDAGGAASSGTWSCRPMSTHVYGGICIERQRKGQISVYVVLQHNSAALIDDRNTLKNGVKKLRKWWWWWWCVVMVVVVVVVRGDGGGGGGGGGGSGGCSNIGSYAGR
jgi:hypothetical protein